MLNQDYFFEFAGMPKSGKTTLLDVVVHYFKRQGFKVSEYHGGGRYSPIDKSAIASLNLYLATKAVEFIVTSTEREKVHNRIHFLDRGIFDRYIFTAALLRLGKIDDHEANTLFNFLMVPRVASKLDGVFIFVTSPGLSVSRENKNKLTDLSGRVMNTNFLTTLRMSALETYEKLKDDLSNIQLINTEEYDNQIEECAKIVVDSVNRRIGL